jgi:hypothetical protein
MKRAMVAFLTQLLLAIRSRFARLARLEAENLVLRQQLVVLRRKSPAVAERLCRAPYRIDPARGSRPPHRVRRSAVAPRSEELRFLLQPGPDASLIAQECAGFSALAEAGPHRKHLNSGGGAASPICQGLAFD